jgi:hypothetical protein
MIFVFQINISDSMISLAGENSIIGENYTQFICGSGIFIPDPGSNKNGDAFLVAVNFTKFKIILYLNRWYRYKVPNNKVIVAYNIFSTLSGNICCKKPQCLLFIIRNFL